MADLIWSITITPGAPRIVTTRANDGTFTDHTIPLDAPAAVATFPLAPLEPYPFTDTDGIATGLPGS